MYELIKDHQLNIMLFLSGACLVTALFAASTKMASARKKAGLLIMEISSAILLLAERSAYIYRGDLSTTGYYMVRIGNFLGFFMVLWVLFGFNIFLYDLFSEIDKEQLPIRIKFAFLLTLIGMIVLIVSQFNGFYYSFDENNLYQRGPGFILSFIFPFLATTIQISVTIQYFKKMNSKIRISVLLFNLMPLIAGVVQVLYYGISLIDMALAITSITLYIFGIADINASIAHANRLEIDFYKKERQNMQILFEQTARALVSAIDAKDAYTHGHSSRVADYSRRIAQFAGMNEEECDEVFYAALLHDVGKIGIPVSIINKNGKLTDEEYEYIKQHPVLGDQILSGITEYPYLRIGARHHHERYDGKGYPDKLKGEDIPEIARIIAVADAYDAMTSNRTYRDAIPQQKVREEFIKNSGSQFDPRFAKIMQHMIDLDSEYEMKEKKEGDDIAGVSMLSCNEYRSEISNGIWLTAHKTTIRFKYQADPEAEDEKHGAAMVLFDSLDGMVHSDGKLAKDLNYFEYGEIRMDGEFTVKGARKMVTKVIEENKVKIGKDEVIEYTIEAVRVRDHGLITIESKAGKKEVTVAFPDSARWAYIGLTGEYCYITDIEVENSEEEVGNDHIERIAEEITYIDGPEGDVPNIQVDGYRSASTEGIPVENGMSISFHAMSLPTARLIWHCPFIDLFYSDDKTPEGDNYREYALVRLDGENWESVNVSDNKMIINKSSEFTGWEDWKEANKKGFDCVVNFYRVGNMVTIETENMGISIKLISMIYDDEAKDVYVCLTGDQVALTNIKITYSKH